jgi:uncharacterized protein (TIGR02246 family)
MNRQGGWIGAGAGVVAASLLAGAASAAAPTGDAQLKALEARFATAVAAKDLDAIMKVYAPDVFVFDVITPRQYVGAGAYRADWKALLAGYAGPVKFELTDVVVASEGTVGYGHSIQRIIGAGPKGEAMDMVVRVSDVYRKQAGKWLIVQEHVSVPLDAKTMQPDLMSKP